MRDKKLRVLFLSTANAGRSQMAEALLRRLAGEDFEVFSAGTAPTKVNQFAVLAVADMGIDISAARAKPASEFAGQQFDFIITLTDPARDLCPTFPGKFTHKHWDFEDPAEAQGNDQHKLKKFKKIRDYIRKRSTQFLDACRRKGIIE